MTIAIARLEAFWTAAAGTAAGGPAPGGGGADRSYGTAFAVSPTLALTAFHCIGELGTGQVRSPRVWLRFRGGTVEADVVDGDAGADYAVLRLLGALPAGEEPIRLAADCQPHERWYSIGYPAAVADVDGYAVSGTVTFPDSRILHGAPAIQLHCEQSAARLPLEGVSGAPVLVGTPALAAGLIRWNPQAGTDPEVAAGAAIYATPLALAAAAVPALGPLLVSQHTPRHGRDRKAEAALLDQLPLARGGRLRMVSRAAVVGGVITACLLIGGGATVVAANAGGDPVDPAAQSSQVTIPGSDAPGTASPTTTPTPAPTATPPPSARPTPTPPPQFTPEPTPEPTPRPTPEPPPTPTPPPDCSAAITIQPSSGPVGTTITIQGTCYQPGERVDVRFHTDVISQPTASATGAFSTTGQVPASYAPFAGNQFSVTATGKQSVQSDSQPFDLTS